MKAVLFPGDRRIEILDIPKPVPGPQEVLIQIKASGMCGTDLPRYRRPASEIPENERGLVRGHEPCGIVAELGPCARNVKVGDRVMIHHYHGCGTCKYCLSGQTHLCLKKAVTYGLTGHGAHQEFMICPDVACVPLPDEMSFEEGASCACGTGTAYQGLKRLQPSGLDTLAIFGQGPVGLNATMLAKAMGARVIAVDSVANRLEMSKRFGADEVVDASKVDPVEVIRELTHGEGADAAMDCTGVGVARVNTLNAARQWGRVCFVGVGGPTTFDVTVQIIRKNLTIYGTLTFSSLVLAEVAQFVIAHKLPLRETITHTFPLSKADEAYRLFDTGTTGKMALIP